MLTAGPLGAGAVSPPPAVLRVAPPWGAAGFGASVTGLGDVDRDGTGDVVVGAPASHHTYVLSGATGGVLHDIADPVGAGFDFGVAVAAVPDVDSDGLPDIAVGAPSSAVGCPPHERCEAAHRTRGRALVFSSAAGTVARELVPVTDDHPGFGRSVVGAEDFSGDGVPDILVGAPDGPGPGAVFAFSGTDGTQLWSRLGPSAGPEPLASFGRPVVATPDVSGDGIGDALVSDPSDSNDGEPAGSVSVLSGATGEVVRVISDPAPHAGDLFGSVMSTIGDHDGDGVVDHLIGERGSDQLHLYSGRDGVLIRSMAAPAHPLGESVSLARVDDKDGDGRDDVWVGIPSARAAYLVDGTGEVLAHVTAPLAEGAFGEVVAAAGSIGDDRRADLVVGAPGERGGGALYLVRAGQEAPAVADGRDDGIESCYAVDCQTLESLAATTAQPTTTTLARQPTTTTVALSTTSTLPEVGASTSLTQTTPTTAAPATASLPKPAGAAATGSTHPKTGGIDRSALGLAALMLGVAGTTLASRLRLPAPDAGPSARVNAMGEDRRREVSGEEGFSLIELLVAMSVFGVVLVGLTGVLISSVRSIGDQRLRTAATRVASHHLETLRTLPFDALDAEAGVRTTTTPDGREFTITTAVATIDAVTGASDPDGRVKKITAFVAWTAPGGASRDVSYSTAVADDARSNTVPQAIGTITMFPSPATTDASGRPLESIEVTVPLQGFPVGTLVHLSWTNVDGTPGAETLTSTTVVNWRGTIEPVQLLTPLGGEVEFEVTAGSLTALYGLSTQVAAASAPAITSSAIDRNPINVAGPATRRTCGDRNQCQNTTDIVFTVTVTGLNLVEQQDSVILQYQLHDGTSVEVPLAPVSGESGHWRLTVRQRTTKFLNGSARAFRFTAIRSADGATTTATVLRDVVST